jgi:hypothetical protein
MKGMWIRLREQLLGSIAELVVLLIATFLLKYALGLAASQALALTFGLGMIVFVQSKGSRLRESYYEWRLAVEDERQKQARESMPF